MCGRVRCTLSAHDVPRACHRQASPARFLHADRHRPSYNVAPGSYMPVLRKDSELAGDSVAVHCMQWGLIPSFTKKTDKPDFFKMFNARSESVAEKASFRRLLPKNRCLVAVDGFYEWKKEGSKKQPYYIHFKDGRPLVFATLFDSWQNSGGETLYTFTILTTTSSTALNWLHDRMPVILGDKDSVDTWLDDPTTLKLKPLLAPYENSDLVWYPVTSAIGKPSFDGPECIQQISLKASQNSLISKFFVAKQPKAEEDKEIRLTDENISGDLKEESAVEGYEGAANDLGFQKIMKAEPFIEDNSAVASHLESVKNEVEESTNEEGKSIKTGPSKETGESNVNITTDSHDLGRQRILKEEPEIHDHRSSTVEELNQLELQHDTVQDKAANENLKMISSCQSKKEGGLEFSDKSSGKGGTKRGFEVFSEQEKPRKHSEISHSAKSCGKHGKKQGKEKSNVKKSKETATQSTLHFFFNEK